MLEKRKVRYLKFANIEDMIQQAEYSCEIQVNEENMAYLETFMPYNMHLAYEWGCEKGDKAFWDSILGGIMNSWNNEEEIPLFKHQPEEADDYLNAKRDFSRELYFLFPAILAATFVYTVSRQDFETACRILDGYNIPVGPSFQQPSTIRLLYELDANELVLWEYRKRLIYGDAETAE